MTIPKITSERKTNSEAETQELGAALAWELHSSPPVFVRLCGALGAGKSAFARGFIRRWLELSGELPPETIVSPTYNIVKVYGTRAPIAHLDLYRLKNMRELEQLGYEHYFFELQGCLVEWLEQVPEALEAMPSSAFEIDIVFDEQHQNQRVITARGPKEVFSAK